MDLFKDCIAAVQQMVTCSWKMLEALRIFLKVISLMYPQVKCTILHTPFFASQGKFSTSSPMTSLSNLHKTMCSFSTLSQKRLAYLWTRGITSICTFLGMSFLLQF